MADEPLEVGQIGIGMIVDGVEDTPWVSGTLTYLADEGIRFQVPFIGSLPEATDAAGQQFGHVRDWFNPDDPRPPHNLVVEMQGRVVGLYDCRWTSTSGGLFGGLSFGSVAAENVVSGRKQHTDGEFSKPLTDRQVRSRLDGLARLTRFSSIKRSTTYNDDKRTIHSARVDVESGESLTCWRATRRRPAPLPLLLEMRHGAIAGDSPAAAVPAEQMPNRYLPQANAKPVHPARRPGGVSHAHFWDAIARRTSELPYRQSQVRRTLLGRAVPHLRKWDVGRRPR